MSIARARYGSIPMVMQLPTHWAGDSIQNTTHMHGRAATYAHVQSTLHVHVYGACTIIAIQMPCCVYLHAV